MAFYENNICPKCKNTITSINRKRHSPFWEEAQANFSGCDGDDGRGLVITFQDYCPHCRNPFTIQVTVLVKVRGHMAFDFVTFNKPLFLDVIFISCQHKARIYEFDDNYIGVCKTCGKKGEYKLEAM